MIYIRFRCSVQLRTMTVEQRCREHKIECKARRRRGSANNTTTDTIKWTTRMEKKKSHGPPTLCNISYLSPCTRARLQANPIKSAYGCRCLRIFLTPCLNQRRPSLLHNRTSSGYTAGQDLLFPLITTRSRHCLARKKKSYFITHHRSLE